MLHTNELELKAALNALMSFTAEACGLSVGLHMGNQTAVTYLNRNGGTRSRALCETALEIARWCESRKILPTGFYVLGKQNVVADAESRAEPSTGDWRLCNDAFFFHRRALARQDRPLRSELERAAPCVRSLDSSTKRLSR